MTYPLDDKRTVRSLTIIDDNDAFVVSLERDLVERGFAVSRAATFTQATLHFQGTAPDYVVSELRVAGQLLSDCLVHRRRDAIKHPAV
jgi:ActR/RegA family two-component response regulator